jgi:hypothetical protein
MSDALTGALLGGSFAIAGIVLSLFFQQKQQEASNRRWLAEFYLKPKIESIRTLYTALTMCQRTFIFSQIRRDVFSTDEVELHTHFRDSYMELESAYTLATPYLEGDYLDASRNAFAGFTVLYNDFTALVHERDQENLPSVEKIRADLNDASLQATTASKLLKELLNPPLLTKLEKQLTVSK